MVGNEVTIQLVAALAAMGLLSLLIIAFINSETKDHTSSYPQDEEREDSKLWEALTKMTHLTSTVSASLTNRTVQGSGRRLSWVEEGHRLRHGGRHHTRGRVSCYTGNEVLIVIGVTCLLNFAFVLGVMACVHYCSSSVKPDLSPRLESVIVESETESEDNRRFHWDTGNTFVSLHNISSQYKHKTPSHSMEQLLFVE